MWAWLYLGVGALATAMTWAFAVREQAVVFTSVSAALSWALLSITPEIVLVGSTDTSIDTTTVTVGPIRWLLAGLALLSFVALIGAIMGWYPESHPEQQFSDVQ